MSDFLTTRQLADRYAIPPCDALQSFDNLLRRWRDRGRLREGVDWRCGEYHVRLYREEAVVRLMLESESRFCASVRMVHLPRMRAVVPRDTEEAR